MSEAAELAWDGEVDGLTTLPIRLAKSVKWRRIENGQVELLDDEGRFWTRYGPNVAPILESLNAGHDLRRIVADMHTRLPDHKYGHVKAIVRSFIFGLGVSGHVEITLPPTPAVFVGRYEKIKELGRGGQGIAWLARDRAASGPDLVVIKHAWNFVQSFRRCEAGLRAEAEVMADLSHPAIVRFHDGFEIEGRYHMVREYVEGDDLAIYNSTGVPQPARRREIGRAIAEALAHVHERGWLFLDLKPTNFMIEANGRVRVCDIGLCRRLVEGGVALKAPIGSRGYAAPEVVAATTATTRSDVFGFGRLYTFLVTGKKPRQGETPESTLARVREAGADPKELALVEACVAVDPARRPSEMREVLALLA